MKRLMSWVRPAGWVLLCVLNLVNFAPPARAAVGRTVGNFAVSATGAATYSIPIFTQRGCSHIWH
jgi:hypothetical protein